MKKLFSILLVTIFAVCSSCANDMVNEIYLTANGTTLTVTLENNKSVTALVALLKKGDITIKAHDYGSFEKVGDLGTTIARSDSQITTKPGDLILYLGNQITIYYDTNSWNFTLLGHVKDATKESMLKVLGSGDVDFTLSLIKLEQ